MADDQSSLTAQQAQAIATRTNLLVVGKSAFAPYVALMKSANPKLTVLVYMNGMFLDPSQADGYPEAMFAHDNVGNRVKSKKWSNYLMNARSSGWSDAVASRCQSFLSASHYDGCYLDMLGTAPLTDGYTTHLPIDPQTNHVWLEDDYIASTGKIAEKVATVTHAVVAGNGLSAGNRYFATPGGSKPLTADLAYAHAESWLRGAASPPTQFKTEKGWKQDVDMLVDAGANGRSVMAMTKVWATATTAQINAWHKYALASFLLGDNGKQWFTFTGGRTMDNATADNPWDRIDIGTAKAPYAKVNGLYQRQFTNGLVLVNPTTTAVTISLPGRYADLDGTVRTSITLQPNQGEVLRVATRG